VRAAARGQAVVPSVFIAVLVAVVALAGTGLTGEDASARVAKRVDEPTTFRATSFNILGASHTAPGGNKPRMASGKVRAGYAARLLDTNAIDVAGLQEVQVSQYDELMRLRGSAWDAYPGRALTNWDANNTLVWRTSVWDAVEERTVAIPYFHGMKVQMPYVLLRNRSTGQQVWFANFHNPASSRKRGDQGGWRKLATSIQVALANQLRATGYPVVFTGDMNEKGVYFCRLTTQTAKRAGMKSASGGSFDTTACRTPKDMRIDWIFGSKELRFSGYKVLRSDLVKRTSDHPMIISNVTVPAG
jgi:endonuclease/exonuclease/phosphatase family metal-dependent hydrolase